MINKKNILVIGDVMLDTYCSGDITRISPEAPVPIFKKNKESSVLGGAANVAANLVAAEQNVSILTIIGKDDNGEKMLKILSDYHINTDLVLRTSRRTTEKTRFLANNNQQIIRLDVEDTTLLKEEECDVLLKNFEECVERFDLILLSDYLKGLLTYEFTQGIIDIAKRKDVRVIIDVKDTNVEKYIGAYLIKPNLKELQELTGMVVQNDDEIIIASEELRKKCNCQYILTTCGARGMVLVGDEAPFFIESSGKEVFDVTGAGDTTIAYVATCLANNFVIKDAVKIANFAAGIQVSKVGTSAVYLGEIYEILRKEDRGVVCKLISGKLVDNFKKFNVGKNIVFTNGCFDILHIGHMRYLQEAAKLGDILVVGLNSDASVKRLKGTSRPINSELERAEMLCAFEFVDYVIIFEEDTPLELIKKIQPDVLVKGGDYENEYIIGTNEVESRGGKLVLIPFVEGKSTTNIIEKIQK